MKFIDEVQIYVCSGAGGAGAVSFRREKFVPRGGPDGGDGGRGGDVSFYADPALATLMDLRYKRRHIAQQGRPGTGKNCTGAGGRSLEISVPVGTQIKDAESGELLKDLVEAKQRFVIARGGLGGRGNSAFATPSRRSPDFAQPGRPGEERELLLELKLLADVGLVGFPNAGKSTLVSRMSRARPRIADYPFTTLRPNLGMVRVDEERSYVIADMPGLIRGAAEGAGLGIRFLKHIERCSLFVFLVTQDLEPGRDPLGDFRALREELGRYQPLLLKRPYLVVLSQMDRPEVSEQLSALQEALKEEPALLGLSAITGQGLKELQAAVAQALLDSGRWGEYS